MKFMKIDGIETSNTNYECFLYSTAKDSIFIMKDSSIICRREFYENSTNPTYSAVLYL